jgi:dihydroneopterin aldolase
VNDAIEVRGLRILAAHGAAPGEQEREQPFEVDFDVEVDTARAAASDDLADAVDYGHLVSLAGEAMRGGPHRLLETLAESVARALLSVPGVLAASVTVRKLRPPVPADITSAGVRVTRRLDVSG